MMTISVIYFVVTGIQFWISDYMITALGASQGLVFTLFSLISITAPTSGVFFGGYISDSIGGYTGERALDFCLAFAILASVFALPIPFLDNVFYVSICFWFLFFFGGSILPTLTGLMLNSVPQRYRSIASSLAQFIMNLTGYLPAPIVYGYILRATGGGKSHWGMGVIVLWMSWGLLFLSLAKYLKHKRETEAFQKRKQEQEDEIEKELQKRAPGADQCLVPGDWETTNHVLIRKEIDIPRFEIGSRAKNTIELADL